MQTMTNEAPAPVATETTLDDQIAQLLTVYDQHCERIVAQAEEMRLEIAGLDAILEQVSECYADHGQGCPIVDVVRFKGLGDAIAATVDAWRRYNGEEPERRQPMRWWHDTEPLLIDGKRQRNPDGSTKMRVKPGSRRLVTVDEYNELMEAQNGRPKSIKQVVVEKFGLSGRSNSGLGTLSDKIAARQAGRRS